MKHCVCGYTSSKSISAHISACKLYKDELKRVIENASTYVQALYLSSFSVKSCVDQIIDKEKTLITHGAIRKFTDSFLDGLGIREGVNGKNNQRFKQQKIRQTTRERYGVDNVGQIPGKGWVNNSIPYKKLLFVDELAIFRKEVSDLTWNTFMRMKRRGIIPIKCHYTGICFNDELLDQVNPNDPFKRSIDHVVPVTEAFFKGWSSDQTASDDNIVFCLRIINTLKSNTNHDDFVTNYLPYIMEKLHESKTS